MQAQTTKETIEVKAEALRERFEQLVHEGNVRRIVVKKGEHTVVEFPLTVGVVGAVLAPMLAVVGALAAVLTDCTIEIERAGEGDEPAP